MPTGSEVQVRTTRGWLIGFLAWILWLFRRGGEVEPPIVPKEDTNTPASKHEPGNEDKNVTTSADRREVVLKQSSRAGDPVRHDATGDLNGSAQAKQAPDSRAFKDLGPVNDGAVRTKHVQAFLERLPEIQRQLLEAETAPGKALAEFMAKLTPTRMALRSALRALRDDYEAMDEMGVHRASKRPDSRVGRVMFMFIFIAVEAIINGSFLAVGIEGGLIAGWLMALGISVFNVLLLGFAFGAMAFRQLNHRRIHRKFLGALAFCAVLALAYSSNLAVAHYRDALDGPDPDNAGKAALATWLANPVNPLKVNGVESLWLLGLGFAFTIIGLIDGCLCEDPYPSYGRFYVAHTRRLADYQSLFQKSFDELSDVEQRQDSQLANLADEINKRLNDYLLLKARYASKAEDPDFDAWKRIEEGFPESRVNAVLIELKDKRGEILDEYTNAMRDLETLDPTINGAS